MPHAVIFDLDGTLADTLDDLAFSVNTILARHGFPIHEKNLYRIMVGNGMRTLVQRVLPEGIATEALVEALRSEASGFYALHALDRTRAYPGISELLDALDAGNIPYAVLSNKPDALARAVVKGVFPTRAFFAVRGESIAFPPKPEPQSALDLAKKMGILPADIFYVGDSNVDVFTARNAGMKSAGAVW
ncbi:MAG: HAD-IA family hydrolase, partial [Rectinemataceae bacterium]|nr:HAD-IA family hydrolase [Rectinemataceae bacterium]